MLNTVIGVG